MDLGLDDRTALVAASTGGLGLAIAQALAAEGANVVLSGRRADVAAEHARQLPSAIGVGVDLTEPDGPAQLCDAAEEAFGQVDIVVLNSGGPRPGAASEVTPDDLKGAAGLLLHPHQRLIQRLLPGMRERGWGRILAVGSSGVQQPIPNLALSNALRGALAGLLKTLAGEVAADGITVNMILPGRIATDRVGELDAAKAEREGLSVAEVEQRSQTNIPTARYGRPEEFGAVAAFLCSSKASYINGSQVRVDGGLIRGL
jgi:3-oxoacyl-[acyl-carrier protein] reductase